MGTAQENKGGADPGKTAEREYRRGKPKRESLSWGNLRAALPLMCNNDYRFIHNYLTTSCWPVSLRGLTIFRLDHWDRL